MDTDARIGIINRGEAAVRFITAVREYNIATEANLETVALFTLEEKDAVFVRRAHHAVGFHDYPGGSAEASTPYTDKELLLRILQDTGCNAVWVGWGFLAEDADFAAMLEEAGIVLMGPGSAAMRLLGDKILAKELAEKARVPVLPWSRRAVESVDDARAMAAEIGYPVILKSANGGGGRGIRKVYRPEDMADLFESASEEIFRFFGNRVIFIEALVVRSRHLEVQVVADQHGQVLTFGVRDCSTQRNNQKIIEETPPPGLSRALMSRMEQASRRLCRAARYEGAATVEYLLDLDRDEFYLMEVNTRLQVEHPITEQLYQIDLVRYQIEVALGRKILAPPVQPRGHVVEARLNAEDPDKGFSPAPGRIERFSLPRLPNVRVDTGFETGNIIPGTFDSMISKIIASGHDRDQAIARLKAALRELTIHIGGGTTNKAFLLEILADKEFAAGGVTTDYISGLLERNPGTFRNRWDVAIIALGIHQYLTRYHQEMQNFRQKIHRYGAPRDIPDLHLETSITHAGVTYPFVIRALDDRTFHFQTEQTGFLVVHEEIGGDQILTLGKQKYQVQMIPRGSMVQCEIDGISHPLEAGNQGDIGSPFPAIVLGTPVGVGETVRKGDILITLEAMKTETIVTAPGDGVVRSLRVRKGEQVSAGQILITMDTADAGEDTADQGETIDFRPFAGCSTRTCGNLPFTWQRLSQEFLAIVKGYDHHPSLKDTVREIEQFVWSHPDYQQDWYELILQALRICIDVERLFAPEVDASPEGLQLMDFQEFLMHFFLREKQREKGLPAGFLERLDAALSWYPEASPGGDPATMALFHIYIAHAGQQQKHEFLHLALQAVKRLLHHSSQVPPLPVDLRRCLQTLGELVADNARLSHTIFSLLYELVDREYLTTMEEQGQVFLADKIRTYINREGKESTLVSKDILDSGYQLVHRLINLANAGDTRLPALELLARKLNRDRTFHHGKVVRTGELSFYHAEVTEKARNIHSLIVVAHAADAVPTLATIDRFCHKISRGRIEVILLLQGSEDEFPRELDDAIRHMQPPFHSLVLGRQTNDVILFRHWQRSQENSLEEEVLKRHIGPLRYRELGFVRFQHFHQDLLRHDHNMHLIRYTAHANPADQRLVAFLEVPEINRPDGARAGPASIALFEGILLKAANSIREQQADSKGGAMNRIVVHYRNRVDLSLNSLPDWLHGFSRHLLGLNLDKVLIYTRAKGRTHQAVPVEIVFENFTTAVTARVRRPLRKPVNTLGEYQSRVLRSQRRACTYPYEIIRYLVNLRNDAIVGGLFEEYDIHVDAEGRQSLVKVAGRPPGQNTSNVVFGIVSNRSGQGVDYRRVIILGDPSRDLGSLAEGECRRVNAALDLAEAEGLPVEWIPVSSGAAITMDSGTENLDWTARTLRRIIRFTQDGGLIHVIVSGINVGAQSYWNAEATMLTHTRGVLIMTDSGSMLLTGKKALDFSGSVSAADNIQIGGVERIMGPNGEAQFRARDLVSAYDLLFRHYAYTWKTRSQAFPARTATADDPGRNICETAYEDTLGQGFQTIGDIFSSKNAERKKPFAMRQLMATVCDQDAPPLERWKMMKDAETAIVWETRIGGFPVGLVGIESQPLRRIGNIPNDGGDSWTGGTLYPLSSKKIARAVNAFSDNVPLVVLANLSGFDGSPESLRSAQLEMGAEIGRAITNFRGPVFFVVVTRYHGGAYVVFSKALNPQMRVAALEGSYASVIGGAPAAAVVFPGKVRAAAKNDPRVKEARKSGGSDAADAVYEEVWFEHQARIAAEFEAIHSVRRAKDVGSIDEIISAGELRPWLVHGLEEAVGVGHQGS